MQQFTTVHFGMDISTPSCCLCRCVTSTDLRKRKKLSSVCCAEARDVLMTVSSSGPVFLDRVCRDQSAILCHSCLNILKNINTKEKKLVKLKGSIQEMLTSVLCEASSPCTTKTPAAPTLVPQTKQIRLTTTGSPSAISTELYTCGSRCAQVSVASTAPSSSSETSTAPGLFSEDSRATVPLNAVHVTGSVSGGRRVPSPTNEADSIAPDSPDPLSGTSTGPDHFSKASRAPVSVVSKAPSPIDEAADSRASDSFIAAPSSTSTPIRQLRSVDAACTVQQGATASQQL